MPFDEIVANSSDLKHIVELLRCSDGLGVVITVSLNHLRVFYWRLQKCYSGVSRRLVAGYKSAIYRPLGQSVETTIDC